MSKDKRECQFARYSTLICSMKGMGYSNKSIVNFIEELYQDYKIDKKMKEELIGYI